MIKVNSFLKSIFSLCVLILSLGVTTLSAQNLALNKPYTLSELPNYSHGAPSTDKTSLTDGIKTNKGTFWSQKTTVGWNKRPSVRIDLDIKQVQPIGSITFGTAGGQSEVYFPQNMYVFISEDGKKYEYVGDIMSAPDLPDTTYTGYRKETFEMKAINRKARFIIIEAIPRNKYLFCDEIEVMRGDKIGKKRSEIKFDIADYERVRDCIKIEEHLRKNVAQVLSEMPDEVKKAAKIESRDIASQSPIEVRAKIGKSVASHLQKRFQSPWTIEKVNPWTDLSPFYQPKSPSNDLNYKFNLTLGGAHYAAFALTNTEDHLQELSIQLSKDKNSSSSLELFEVRQVPVTEGRFVADPILPIHENVKIEAGETKWVFFKVEGQKVGSSTQDLSINSKNKKVNVSITTKVSHLGSKGEIPSLSTVVWAYFNRPILKSKPMKVGNDLRQHHINTVVVPTAMLSLINSNDYSKVTDYLKGAGKFDKVLLFNSYNWVDRKNGYKNGQFMSSEWKRYFIQWYAGMQKALKTVGYSEDQIYFYPYDEINDPDEIQDYLKLIQWAKQNVKGIQFYATLSYEESVQLLTPWVDVVQLHHQTDRMKTLPKHDAEIWTYSGGAPFRTYHPYSYFRLMAWEAFANGYQGIGFWNYSTNHEDYPIDRLLLSPATDYSVIYTGEGDTIYSTRRWEAFRLGIEDYDILMAYSKKYGYQKTKEMADDVLSHPEDLDKADLYRNMMLSGL